MRSQGQPIFAAALLFSTFAAQAQYFPPPESSGGWRRLVPANTTPSSQQKDTIRSTVGLDWDVLKNAWDASSQYGGTFLVIRNGWIAAEWGSTGTAIPVGSCTKTFTSLAMHRMFQMGANGSLAYPIAPDDLAYLYLPASWGSNATRRTIALRHLLTMSSGLEPDDSPPSPNGSTDAYQQKLLDPPVRTVPEAEWSYASLPVDTLSLVTEYVTGQTLGTFFQQQIGSVIGATTLKFASFGTHSYASAYSQITGRDIARVSYLLLNRGTWNSTSIVSGSRIDSMTRWAPFLGNTVYGPQIKFPTDPETQNRYGWLVWTNRTQSSYVGSGVPTDAYYCAGFRTNFAMVIPSLDLIIVRLQDGPTPWSDAVFTNITSTVMSAMVDGSANTPPTAQLTSPANGASFTAPASIAISASASDSDGSVTQVALYAGASLLGTDTTAPYAFNWNDVPAGSYALTVRATDNDGAITTSAAINITVTAAGSGTGAYEPEPNGTVSIEAEHADVNVADNAVLWTLSAPGGASGGQAMEAPANSKPRLEYRVNFRQTGTYYVWVRGWGTTVTSDSAFFGFDDAWLANIIYLSPLNGWVWKGPFTMNVVSAGVHTLGITRRESLVLVDKIFVGTSSGDKPTGTGPAESTRGGSSNTPPTAQLTSPANGASFTAPANIALAATASDSDGSVTQVAFYAGTTLLGTDTTAPYAFNWNGVPAGSYALTARSTDDEGATTTSTAVNVTVTAADSGAGAYEPEPNGTVSIEAEHADANVADNAIVWKLIAPSGASGGQAMEAPANGKPRLEYRVNFYQTGTYYVWVRGWGTSRTSDSAFFGFDGAWLANMIHMSPLNGWVWKGPFTMNVVSAGVHTLGITHSESLAQVDKIFVGTSSGPKPTGTGPDESTRR